MRKWLIQILGGVTKELHAREVNELMKTREKLVITLNEAGITIVEQEERIRNLTEKEEDAKLLWDDLKHHAINLHGTLGAFLRHHNLLDDEEEDE